MSISGKFKRLFGERKNRSLSIVDDPPLRSPLNGVAEAHRNFIAHVKSQLDARFIIKASALSAPEEHLGKGPFCDVLRRNCRINRVMTKIACKIVREDSMLQQFTEEAKLLSTLTHPNITRFIGVSLDAGLKPLFLFELMPNGTVADYVKENEVLSYELLRFSKEIASGLLYLHTCHVVHGFLLSRNCMLTSDLHVKIANFNDARRLDDNDRWHPEPSLSPVWFPPEARTREKINPAFDIWAFGHTVWAMHNKGASPYSGFSSADAVYEFLKSGRRLPKPESCSQYLYEGVLLACWEWDPEGRADATEIHAELTKQYRLLRPSTSHSSNLGTALQASTIKILEFKEVLGKGNYGVVHRALCLVDNTQVEVACKVIGCQVDNRARQELLDEASLMASLIHPHVLGLIGVTHDRTADRAPVIVTELMVNGSLYDFLRTNDVSELEKLNFGRDIASGMTYLHSNHVVHRDLAARNCMLSDKMRVKISDFGLSRHVVNYDSGYVVAHARQLPFRWMPPEVFAPEDGEAKFTYCSDVWSFGVVMWELYSRAEIPYRGLWNGIELYQFLSSGFRLAKPDSCPKEIYTTLMKPCWAMEPDERPDFGGLFSMLERLSKGKPSRSESETTLPRALSILRLQSFDQDGEYIEIVPGKPNEA